MSFIPIFIPRTRKAAAYALIVVAIFSAIILSITGVIFAREQIKLKTWIKAEAIVTEYDMPEPGLNWTVFSYEIDGKLYQGKHYGIGLKDKIGETRDILCNPKDPTESIYEEDVTTISTAKILAKAMIPLCSVLILFYGAIYIYQKRKESYR